jgi:myosin heavy subunit
MIYSFVTEIVDQFVVCHMLQELCLETALSATELDAAPDDMISLPEVNQASILSCIRNLFNKKVIYTAIGTVLMSVNPFDTIPGLYGISNVYRYMNPYAEGSEGVLGPHVYLVPSRAFADMSRSGLDQSILIR